MKLLKTSILIFSLLIASISFVGTASAADGDCDPNGQSFPGYQSGTILLTVDPDDPYLASIPARRGFYCIQANGTGLGFGYDKAWHRHNITNLKSIQFALKAPYFFAVASDIGGTGYNFVSYARRKECDEKGNCEFTDEQKVVAATTTGNSDYYYGMPAGHPVGLVTVYCDYGDPTRLLCEPWVDVALAAGLTGTP